MAIPNEAVVLNEAFYQYLELFSFIFLKRMRKKSMDRFFYGVAKLGLQQQALESIVNINLQAQNLMDSNMSPYSRSH